MNRASMRREVVLPGRATKGSQSWEYEATWKLGGQVVRVCIKRDAYAFQSDLRVDVWDPRGRAWNPLLSRPIAGYRVQNVNAYSDDPPNEEFHADESRLLREAAAILTAARARP